MSNPFEYREIMQASMHFNETRTVDQVLAEHEQRHNERAAARPQRPTPTARRKGSPTPVAPTPRQPTQGQMNALQSLLDRAQALRDAKEA